MGKDITTISKQSWQSIIQWLSYKERRENALASGAEEGRGKQRYATGSRKQTLIRRIPNGAIRQCEALSSYTEYIGIRGEPTELKHLSRARKRNQPRFS